MIDVFLSAQSEDPFDPTPMLIWADYLEEHGDLVAAEILRQQGDSGKPSLHAISLEAAIHSSLWKSDVFDYGNGAGDVFEYSDRNGYIHSNGNGRGDEYGNGYNNDGYGYGIMNGETTNDGYGDSDLGEYDNG